jgi:hypothetical protein
MGRVFPTKLTTPSVSFMAALKAKTEDQRQPLARQVPIAVPATMELRAPAPLLHQIQQPTGQSVPASLVNSAPLDSMLRVVTVEQQIMTRVQWCCVRGRQNSGHYQNCLKSYEA